MPGVRLVPYPVVHRLVRAEAWWSSPQSAQVLALEYLKYVRASTRLRLSHLLDRPTRAAALQSTAPLMLAPPN